MPATRCPQWDWDDALRGERQVRPRPVSSGTGVEERHFMALMMSNLYEALRQVHVSDELARKAAEEVAGYESQIAIIRSDLQLLKWMVGVNVGLTLIVLGRLFLPLAQ